VAASRSHAALLYGPRPNSCAPAATGARAACGVATRPSFHTSLRRSFTTTAARAALRRTGHGAPATAPARPLGSASSHIEARLGRAPRYRQMLAPVPLACTRPEWGCDPDFSVDRHVYWTSGRPKELVNKVMSMPLRRDWEPAGANLALKAAAHMPGIVQNALSKLIAARARSISSSRTFPALRSRSTCWDARCGLPIRSCPSEAHSVSVGMTTGHGQACFGIYADRASIHSQMSWRRTSTPPWRSRLPKPHGRGHSLTVIRPTIRPPHRGASKYRCGVR
jgi:Wax ester synthase-like Acyl-CoA acyltransferase domain